MLLRASAAADGTAAAPGEGRAGAPTPAIHPLHGSWSATRWQYTSRARPERVVDVVAGLGGSVTLSLTDGTWVLTWVMPGSEGGTVGGSVVIDGERLELLRPGSAAPESVLFRLAAETLALSSDASAWAFADDREEPAAFIAVLVRL